MEPVIIPAFRADVKFISGSKGYNIGERAHGISLEIDRRMPDIKPAFVQLHN
jgi:hypothetical protein